MILVSDFRLDSCRRIKSAIRLYSDGDLVNALWPGWRWSNMVSSIEGLFVLITVGNGASINGKYWDSMLILLRIRGSREGRAPLCRLAKLL